MRGVGKVTARGIAVLVFALAIGGLSYVPVSAKDAVRGLALSPLRSEYDIDPGGSKNTAIKVSNFTAKPLDVTMDVEEFNVTGQQYDYQFSADTGVSKWVSFATNNLHINPGQTRDDEVTVTVPAGTEPGGYYISLFATNDQPAAAGAVRTVERVASLLYITVAGDVTRTGSLKSLQSPFIFDGYTKWKMLIANTGTTHFRSQYTVSLRNIFDGSEAAKYTGSSLILPGTERAVYARIPAPHYAGIYRVIYHVGLGDSPAVMKQYWIVFLPAQAVAPLITLTVIILAGLVYAAVKLLRRK